MNDERWIQQIRDYIENDVEAAVGEIVGFSNYAENYERAEAFLIELSGSREPNVRGISILGLGHLARVHRRSSDKAVAVVKEALADPDQYISGHADSALDDISHFTEFVVNERNL